MVSLYNGNTVQRIVVTTADGEVRLAAEVLGDALQSLNAAFGR
jgi:hypothetical protein